MKPQLVVNHQEKEHKLEALTLVTSENDVRQLLISLQEKRDEIDTLCKDRVKYDVQQLLTLIFDKLMQSSCEDFTS